MNNLLQYVITRPLKNMRRYLLANLTTTGIVVVTMLIFSIFSLIAFNLKSFLKIWESKVWVIAYLRRDTSLKEIEELLKKVRQFEWIEEIKYISPFDAMAFMEERLGNQKNLLEGIRANIFPPSLEIQLKREYRDSKKIDLIVSQLRSVSKIEEVQYGQDLLDALSGAIRLIHLVQWILGGLILISMFFIISNTIKFIISYRREEIEVMHLLGANPAFIQVPYYIEGAIQGFLGAAMAILLLFILFKIFYPYITPFFKGWLAGIKILFLPMESILLILSGGTILGLFGSFVGSMRFMKYRG